MLKLVLFYDSYGLGDEYEDENVTPPILKYAADFRLGVTSWHNSLIIENDHYFSRFRRFIIRTL